MSRKRIGKKFTWAFCFLAGLWAAGSARAQEFRASFGAVGGGCASGNCGPALGSGSCHSCQRFHCPPHYKHCQEGAPRLHFQKGCPRPICDPCTQPNWGYYQTCWTPWPWAPNWSHCPVQPPAAAVIPGVRVPGDPSMEEMPTPQTPRPGL